MGNNDSKPPDGDAENLDYEPLPGLDDELTREQVRENVRQSDAEAVADAGDELIAGLEESARQDGLAWESHREAPAGAPGSEIVIYRYINALFEESLSDVEREWLERQPKGSIDKAAELILRREAGDQYVSYDEGILLDNLAVDWDAFLEEIERAEQHEEGERTRAQFERDRRWYVSMRSLIDPMFVLWTLLALTGIAFVFIFVLSSGGGDSTGDAANETQEPAPEATEDGTKQSSDTDVLDEGTSSGGAGSSGASGETSDGNQPVSFAAFFAAGLPAQPLAAGYSENNFYTDTAPIPPDEVNFPVLVYVLEDGSFAFTLEGDLELLLSSSWKFANFDGNPLSETLITGNTDISIFTNEELVNADPENVLRFADAVVMESDEVPAGNVIAVVITEINIGSDLTTVFIDGFAPTESDGTALVGIVFQEVRELKELGTLPDIKSLFKTDQERPSLMILVEPGLVLPDITD